MHMCEHTCIILYACNHKMRKLELETIIILLQTFFQKNNHLLQHELTYAIDLLMYS